MKRSVIFPDYGNQYVGMGKELYDTQRVMQEYFEEAADCLGINFVKLCFASSEVELSSLPQGPLSLFLVEAASGGMLREHGVTYELVTGLDMVSWYAAVHAAHGVSFPDGLYIIRKWSELYTTAMTHEPMQGMDVVVTKYETIAMVTAWCEQLMARGDGYIAVTRVMPDRLFVVGTVALCAQLQVLLTRESLSFQLRELFDHFDVLMPTESAQQAKQYLEKVDFATPLCPVLDPLQGVLLTTADELRATASALLERPVRGDAIVAHLKLYAGSIVAIPSLNIRDRLQRMLPEQSVTTLESEAASWHSQAENIYHDSEAE